MLGAMTQNVRALPISHYKISAAWVAIDSLKQYCFIRGVFICKNMVIYTMDIDPHIWWYSYMLLLKLG